MSIKKCSLIAGATIVAVLAMASSALADQGAKLTTAKASPSTSITAGKANTGGLYLDVTNCNPGDSSCISSGGTTPTQVLDGINLINISWSGEVILAKPKNPTCSEATLAGLSYKNALLACNGSELGNGGATACAGGATVGGACTALSADVIVFRGPDFTDPGYFGKPGKVYTQLNLYADVGPLQVVVPSVLTPASKADKANGLKTTLHVFGSGDPTSPPSTSLTDLWANVNSGLKVKCGLAGQTGSTTIKYQGQWVVDDPSPTVKTDSTTQPCSYVP